MTPRRSAVHLGLRDPDRPLLRPAPASPGATRSVIEAHLQRAHDCGFAGCFDNFMASRGERYQAQLGETAARLGLEVSSLVHNPERWNQPDWVTGDALADLDRSLRAAELSGATRIVCVTGSTGAAPADQRQAMAEHLRRAADRAGGSGRVLCVEATHEAFAPGLLLQQWEEALEVVRLVDHPAVRLDLDVGHIALHGRDPAAAIRATGPWIGSVQLADVPGRVEPGAGTIDWPAVFAALDSAGWQGILELECEPRSHPGDSEAALLERLCSLGLLGPRPVRDPYPA